MHTVSVTWVHVAGGFWMLRHMHGAECACVCVLRKATCEAETDLKHGQEYRMYMGATIIPKKPEGEAHSLR